MTLKIISRLAGVALLSAGLAGCMDVTAEIDVLSETMGKSTTTMTVGSDFFPMFKQMAEAGDSGDGTDSFCTEEGDVLTENSDGSGTCTSIKEGELATLTAEGDGPNSDTVFTVVSPGVVRVAFTTSEMTSQITEGSEQDPQTTAMMKTYFEGHTATIRVKGKRIVETNMTKVGDNAAEMVLNFTELLDGSADLPPEFFAVVDTR